MASNDSPTPTRGIPVQLDRERHVRFTLKTIREIREEFGADMLTAGFTMDAIAKLLWHGLKHEDPSLTVELVEDLVDMENLTAVIHAVTAATGGRIPAPGEGVPPLPPVDAPAPAPAAEPSPTAGATETVTG